MCGIIGMASTGILVDNDKKFFRSALHCDQLRGADSTGIFTVDKEVVPNIAIFKKAYAAADYMQMRRAEKLINTAGSCRVMVGHNRSATKGLITHHNAHPFQYGSITLVHNGTLNNYTKLPGYDYQASDSKLLCRGIAELGVQGAIDCISGAYALVWHDADDNTLNFLRNADRPLAIASNNDRKDLYFASERMMLDWLTARHGIKIDELLDIQVDHLLKLSLDDKVFNPIVTEVKKKTIFQVGGSAAKKPERQQRKQSELPAKQSQRARDTLLADRIKAMNEEGMEVPDIGEMCQAYFYNITPYNSNANKGVMLGTMTNAPWLTCELHNQKTANFAEGYYDFRVCGRRLDSTINNDFEILGHQPKLVHESSVEGKEKATTKKSRSPFAKDVRATLSTTMTQTTTKTPRSVLDSTKPAVTAEVIQLGAKHCESWKERQKKLQATKVLEKDVGKVVKDGIDARNASNGRKDYYDAEYPYLGFAGCRLSQKVYDQCTKHGCCNCTGNISDDDAPDLMWIDTMSPLCLECQAEQEYGSSMQDPDTDEGVMNAIDRQADEDGNKLH